MASSSKIILVTTLLKLAGKWADCHHNRPRIASGGFHKFYKVLGGIPVFQMWYGIHLEPKSETTK